MIELLKLIAEVINNIHDKVIDFVEISGLGFNDKQLHFIGMAIIGIVIFAITQLIFKKLAKYSITAISFIYTFTIMIVIVFAIEIEQKLTNRGNMEFADIAYGMYGFIYIFAIYLAIKLIFMLIKSQLAKLKVNKEKRYQKEIEEL